MVIEASAFLHNRIASSESPHGENDTNPLGASTLLRNAAVLRSGARRHRRWVQSPAEVAAGFDRLASVKPSRKAALYDALHAALVKAGSGPHPKRAIILISDGRNDGSKLKREELFDAVRRSDALVYAVSAKSGDVNLIEPSDYGTLDKLCSISGGFVSSAGTEADFHAFFERLSVELKNQYAVGFATGSTCPDGGWRRLSFKAQVLELKRAPSSKGMERIQLYVRGREGYYCDR